VGLALDDAIKDIYLRVLNIANKFLKESKIVSLNIEYLSQIDPSAQEVARIMHQLANILEDLECDDNNITLNVKQCIWVIEGIANAIVAGESAEEMEQLYSKLEKHVNVPVPL
jgi:predicted membrane GTPase involved in stress response